MPADTNPCPACGRERPAGVAAQRGRFCPSCRQVRSERVKRIRRLRGPVRELAALVALLVRLIDRSGPVDRWGITAGIAGGEARLAAQVQTLALTLAVLANEYQLELLMATAVTRSRQRAERVRVA